MKEETKPFRFEGRAIAWYYTTGQRFVEIVKEGTIQSDSEMDLSLPVVWFSLNPQWEWTVTNHVRDKETGKRVLGDMQSTYEDGRGLVRLGVFLEIAPHTWEEYKAKHCDAEMASRIEKTCERMGANPQEWRYTYDPVPIEDCVLLHVYENQEWTNVDIEETRESVD